MLRIILVDDNPADAVIFQTALRRTGAPVEIMLMTDGREAVDYLTQKNGDRVRAKHDLLLLDLNLPGLSGFEVLESIRACADIRSLPVVVMSGSNNPADIDRSYMLGANSYVLKATNLHDILETGSELVTYWSRCAQLPHPVGNG
ncbi:MAG TPA: response regulator [Bryobacteraceae bacterium]|nr:response regulator [Bryobacteraceae bacterium]